LFLFSQTAFGPSSEVHGALKTIMGLSRAQMDILIKTISVLREACDIYEPSYRIMGDDLGGGKQVNH
jgi:hypothetical protein